MLTIKILAYKLSWGVCKIFAAKNGEKQNIRIPIGI